jgi:multidrug efflux pump
VAAQYRDLVIAYRNGQAVKLSDVAEVDNSVENLQNAGLYNSKAAVLVIIHPSPSANVIQTVNQLRALLPGLRAALPPSIDYGIALDRSQSIRAAIADTERTLFIAVLLVVAVVFVFLRSPRATLIPGLAVPVSIIGTFGPMYLLGFSLDNLSLMALTISTGFVVDDAVVVVENTMRHLEDGMDPMEAALRGGSEVSFTVLSMSLSLIAVFLPILLMPGLVGRLFQEFAETLSITILISLVVSLTTTPMLCALLLRHEVAKKRPNWFMRWIENSFNTAHRGYERSLTWALRHAKLVGLGLLLTVILNVVLFVVVPKGFFPEQDTGLIIGTVQADQSISFDLMKRKLTQLQTIVQDDPGVASVAGYTGGRATNSGFLFITLKPLAQRHASATAIVARLRRPLAKIAGAQTFLVPAQDLRVGGRQSNAEYQYTLQSDDAAALTTWVPKIVAALAKQGKLADVSSDLQQGGLETEIQINRAQASRLDVTPSEIDNTLYDAFGQRTVSTIYNQLNQYEVVMELAPKYQQTPVDLSRIYVSTSGGKASGVSATNAPAGTVVSSTSGANAASGETTVALDSATNQAINSIASSGKSSASSGTAVSTNAETMVPLSAFASYAPGTTPISVNHQGGRVAATISFNLPAGVALGTAAAAIETTMSDLDVPLTITGSFAGTAAAFQSSLSTEPLLVLAALTAVYIVLGILYESTIHPLTILSTIPSAGIGATLFLLILNTPLTIIALIGVILLIGIVKKNAILMIDFALQLERGENLPPEEAIFQAAMLRFRPILMTTFAAILGGVPLAIGLGQGASLRQPLGITIIGGLIVSQMLTLYTTPVVYLYLDRLGMRLRGGADRSAPRAGGIVEARG